MVVVTAIKKNGMYAGFRADGHADYAEKGKDIVCAASSALLQGCVQGLMEVMKLDIVYTVEPEGRLTCELPSDLSGTELEKSQLLIEVMFRGLQSIAAEYGDHLRIEEG